MSIRAIVERNLATCFLVLIALSIPGAETARAEPAASEQSPPGPLESELGSFASAVQGPPVVEVSNPIPQRMSDADAANLYGNEHDFRVRGGSPAGWCWIPWEDADQWSILRHGPHVFDGARMNQRGWWGTPNIKVADPKDYPHITSLDNDNPNSFFYTLRPNLLGIPVPDEWDWLNMINTERPDFTDLTYTVGKGITYVENGFTYTHYRDPVSHISTRTLPETLVRYGITDEFEVRIKFWEILVDQQDVATGANYNNFGGNDIDLTCKYEVLQQNDWLPMTVLIPGALLPTGQRGFSGNAVQPHLQMVNGWGIRRWLYLKHESGYNYLTQPGFTATSVPGGVTFLTDRPKADMWQESISLIYHLSKHFGGFYEWYTMWGHNVQSQQYVDMGWFFYPTPNVQVDFVVGQRINDTSTIDASLCKIGFSTRW